MEPILTVEKLYKKYENNVVLNNINLSIQKGEFVVVMGKSGSGKTTLLYSISGMNRCEGTILFHQKNLSSLTDLELSQIRLAEMGFIFQYPYLLKNLKVMDNILLPGFTLKKYPREEVLKKAKKLLHNMEISELETSDIDKISGGQLQRVSICRALINEPLILFGDEPTGALNLSTTKEVMDLINEINKDGTTVVLVTHDVKVALRADRVIFLEDGTIKSSFKQERYNNTLDLEIREKHLLKWLYECGF